MDSGRDTYHRLHPKVNAHLSDRAKPPATALRAGRPLSALVQRLARRLGRDADALAGEIPPDTLRRTQYPVLEKLNPDGTRTFTHDEGIDTD